METLDAEIQWSVLQCDVNDMHADHPEYRYGQSLFNTLAEKYPTFANSIAGSELDPFYYNGLPISKYGALKAAFIDYLTEGGVTNGAGYRQPLY